MKVIGKVKEPHGLKGDLYIMVFSGDVSWLPKLKSFALKSKTAGEITAECIGQHAHAVAGLPSRRRRRAFDLLIASISAVGGSTTIPATISQRLPPIDANNSRYCRRGAMGDFTVMTDSAKPAMRSPNTAAIEAPIEKLRLCRVVRGVPRNAKVNAAKANG